MGILNCPAQGLAPSLGGHAGLVTGREPELSGLRALVSPPLIVHVDDEPQLLFLVELILSRLRGYRYIGFANGRDALECCREQRPALLITDLMRPEYSGPELIRDLRADMRLAELPILILTARAYGSGDHWLDERAIFHLTKPFLPDNLLATIDDVVACPLQSLDPSWL